jgi:hypothetical protein
LAAWDVHRAKVFGRRQDKTGIAPVDRLVREVMSQEPSLEGQRLHPLLYVFTVLNNSGNLLLARSKPRRLNYIGFWYGKSTAGPRKRFMLEDYY